MKKSEDVRRMATWAAAAFGMFLVVAGWAWSFQLAVPSSTDDASLKDLSTSFTSLFNETQQSFTQIRDNAPQFSVPPAEVDTPAVDPKVLEALKEKIVGTTSAATLPQQLPR